MSTYAVTIDQCLPSFRDPNTSPWTTLARLHTGVRRSPSFEVHQFDVARARHSLELSLNALDRDGQWKHFLADLHVSVRRKRMPEHPVKVHRDFRNQVGHTQFETFLRVTAPGQWAHEVVRIRDAQGPMKR